MSDTVKYSATTGKPLAKGEKTTDALGNTYTQGQSFSGSSSSSSTKIQNQNIPAYNATTGLLTDYGKSLGLPEVNSVISTDTLNQNQNIKLPQQKTNDYSSILNGITNFSKLTTQDLLNTKNQAQDASTANILDLIKSSYESLGSPPSSADAYKQAQKETGILQKQKLVSDLTSQLNQITAQGQANQLSVVGQGRGIPEAIIGGQQAQIARETAIASLPVSAQLSAAQGNLEMAQQNLDTLFKIYSDDAKNEYEYKKNTIDTLLTVSTSSEQAKLKNFSDTLDKQYEQTQSNIKSINEIANQAIINGASSSLINKLKEIDKSKPDAVTEAIQIAGKYGGDYLKVELLKEQIKTEKAQREKIYSDINTKTEKPATQAQFTAAGFASRVSQAKDLIDKNTEELMKLGTTGYLYQKNIPNFLQSSLVQQELQAERNFVNAVLRRESGAAIADSEFESAAKQYFPQPGDSPEVLEQKKLNRDLTSNNLINEAGNAYQAPQQNNLFSEALGKTGQSIPGTMIIQSVSPDGSINFKLP